MVEAKHRPKDRPLRLRTIRLRRTNIRTWRHHPIYNNKFYLNCRKVFGQKRLTYSGESVPFRPCLDLGLARSARHSRALSLSCHCKRANAPTQAKRSTTPATIISAANSLIYRPPPLIFRPPLF